MIPISSPRKLPGSPPFRVETLLERFRGNKEIAKQVILEFDKQVRADLDSLVLSLQTNNLEAISSVAHALKGAAGILSAQVLHDLSAELVRQARSGHMDNVDAHLAHLRTEVEECLAYLSTAQARLAGMPGPPEAAQGDIHASSHC
jgi:HPt (histidine-containing phosphotransfer) domain-containing protein